MNMVHASVEGATSAGHLAVATSTMEVHKVSCI